MGEESAIEHLANMTFYDYITNEYGYIVTKSMKNLANCKTRLVKQTNKRIFLLRCRKDDIFPTFLQFNLHHISINNNYYKRRLQSQMDNFKRQTLNIIIGDTIAEIRRLTTIINNKTNYINQIIPECLFHRFLEHEEKRCATIFKAVKRDQTTKFNNLRTKSYKEDANIKCDTENWIINLSQVEVPQNIKEILSLGPNFATPYKNTDLPTEDIIASIESAISEKNDEEKTAIRKSVCVIVENEKRKIAKKKKEQTVLEKNINKTKTFLKEHKELTITTADKSRKTVIMEAEDYNQKMKTLLSDNTTYKKINKDPTNVQQNKNNQFVQMLTDENLISLRHTYELKLRNGHPPKIYGLPKIHKQGTPLRPIVSCIQSPYYNLQKFLANVLQNIVGKTTYNVKNSWIFVERIKENIIPRTAKMISLDVVSMYTSIPRKLVINTINNRWKEIQQFTNLPQEYFVNGIDMCINSTYFTFQGDTYEQVAGLPMGAPLSAVAANLVLEDLEKTCIEKCGFPVYLYQRYVDDIFAIVPADKTNDILRTFNQYNKNIQFTLEEENNNGILFLDLKITREKETLQTEWNTKKTWSGRYMNYKSELPSSFKKNVVTNLINRAVKLTTPKYRPKKIKLIKETLKKNGYPPEFTNPIIKREINKIYNQRKHQADNKKKENKEKTKSCSYVALPYVRRTTERLQWSLSKFNIKIASKNNNNLKEIYTKLKDKTEKKKQTHVIYKINCEQCPGTYIGQTKQYLENRLKAHKNSVANKNKEKTALKKHVEDTKHTFDFENVKILKKEVNEKKRLVLEMIEIKKDKNTINDRRDIEDLDKCYHNLL